MCSRSRQRWGFFLLEACMGILLLGIIGCVMATWKNTLTHAEQEIVDRIKAILLARSLLEEYRATGSAPTCAKKEGFAVMWQMLPEYVSVTVRSKLRTCTLKTKVVYEKRNKSP